jgi:catechol 2,3-dioxygenase
MSVVDQRESLVRSRLIERIARVDLRVRDVESSLTFYRDVVGLEVRGQTGVHAVLAAPGDPAFLTLDSTGVTRAAEPDATGLFHIAIRLPARGALGDVLARLAAAGMQVGAGDHAVSEALYVSDPDGNGVELYWDRPVDEWPAPAPGALVPMVTLPVDLNGLLAEGRGQDAVGDSAAPGTDMGHVHLQVSDVVATAGFYADDVGLDLTARMGAEAAFFSSNGYHYHLGANSWRSRGGRPSSKGAAGLERIVFAVDGAERVEHLRLRLQQQGRSVSGEEGRTVVVDDPDGIELRFEA